jgi:hypothetical protein
MQNQRFQLLNDLDVVSITQESHMLAKLNNFQVQDFYATLRELLGCNSQDVNNYHWFGKGIAASLLEAHSSNSGWKIGQIRLCLAFLRDEDTATHPSSSHHQLIPCYEDVLRIEDSAARLINRNSVLISEMNVYLRQKLGIAEPSQIRYYWIDRGIDCEVLQTTGDTPGWQSGLVRLQFEFLPKIAISSPENSVIGHSELESLRQSTTS